MCAAKSLVLSLLAMLPAVSVASGQSSWCAYEPRTFEELLADIYEEGAETAIILAYDRHPSRVPLAYTAQLREIPADRFRFMDNYFRRVLGWPEASESFQHELLFRDGSNEYWLPVQEVLISQLEEEAAPGDSVTVFTMWIGSEFGGRHVFVVNEFFTAESFAMWDSLLATCPKE